jgi:hypothetical protein
MEPILRKTHWFTVSENRNLTRILEPESEEFTGDGTKFQNE